MKRAAVWVLLAAAAASAQIPAVTYFHPSGTEAPTNTKLLARVTCCGAVEVSTLTTGSQNVPGQTSRQFPAAGEWVVFAPAQTLQPRTLYTYTLKMTGGKSYSFNFTTGAAPDTTPPAIVATQPANGGDLSVSLAFSVQFSEVLNPLTVDTALALNNLATSFDISYSINVVDPVTLTGPSLGDFLGGVYRARFANRLPEDLAGNKLAVPLDVTFSAYPSAPRDGPRLRDTLPLDGESGPPINSTIFVRFDRPVSLPSVSLLRLGSSGDPQVPIKLEALPAGDGFIVRPQTLLRGNQDYTLHMDAFYDSWGGRFSGGDLVRFRTGTLPESRVFTVAQSPSAVVPRVSTLRWTLSRPANPYLLPRMVHSTLADPSKFQASGEVRLLADGITLEADVPEPGLYQLNGPVYDRLEFKPVNLNGSYPIQVNGTRDERPPSVLGVFPSPDMAVAGNTSISALFDESLDASVLTRVTVRSGDSAIPCDVTMYSNQVNIRPRTGLVNGDYRVEIPDPRDLSGNTSATVAWNFQVPATAASDKFAMISAEPPDGAQKVDPHATLILTFNRPVNQVNLIVGSYPAAVIVNSTAVPGRWRFEGNQAIFAPDGQFPAGSHVFWYISASDFAGASASGTGGGFWTTPPESTDPFRVIRMLPADGEPSIAGPAAILLELNQTPLASTLRSENFILTGPISTRADAVSYDPNARQVRIDTSTTLNGVFTLAIGPDLLSQSGVALEPFQARIQLRPKGYYQAPQNNGKPGPFLANTAQEIRAGAPLSLYFNQPMPHDLVERGLTVYAGPSPITGRIDWTPDSTALRFTPSNPLGGDTAILVVLSLVPWNSSGVELLRLRTGTAPAPSSVNWSILPLFAYLPSDSVLDAEFDADHPADYVIAADLSYYEGATVVQTPMTIDALSARRFRFHSSKPLSVDRFYTILLKTKGGDVSSPNFRIVNALTPLSRQLYAGPTEAMGAAPVNAQIWVETKTPLNALTIKPSLTGGGAAVPFTVELADNGYLVLLHPLSILDGNTTYTVSFRGLEDAAGRSLPDRTWTFRTGPGPDRSSAQVVSSSPNSVSPSSGVLRVSYNLPVYLVNRHRYDYPNILSDFTIGAPPDLVTATLDHSADGRTVAYVPDRAWLPGSQVTASAGVAAWNGVSGYISDSPSWRISTLPTRPRPVIDAVNPYRDAPDAPLNTLIQFRFAEPVDISGLKARLEADGEAVAASVIQASDGVTFTISPAAPLQAGRNYTVTVEGARAVDGTPQDPPETWSFRTGASLASAAPTVRGNMLAEQPGAFRLTAERPVNATSITQSSVVLEVWYTPVISSATIGPEPNVILLRPLVDPGAASLCGWTLTGVTDWAGNALTGRETSSPCAPSSDREVPLLSLTPPDGGTMPWNNDPAIVASEPVRLRYGSAGVRVTNNGSPVPVTIDSGTVGSLLRIRALRGWTPGEAYVISVRGLADFAGNEVPPFDWTVRISSDPTPDAIILRKLSSVPASGAVGVPTDTVVSMDFNRPVFPESAYPASFGANAGGRFYDLTGTLASIYQGPHAQLTSGLLPAGANVSGTFRFTDALGSRLSTSIVFTTAALPDTTAPVLESITPEPGSTVTPAQPIFTLRFSEPVLFGDNSARFSIKGGMVQAGFMTSPLKGDGRTVQLSFPLPPESTGTLDLLAGITDLSGNPLSPVSLVYTTGPAEPGALRVVSSIPSNNAYAVPANAVLEITFNQPVTDAGLRPALNVHNGGVLVAITLTGSADGRTWRVAPNSPWLPGSRVSVEIGTLAYGAGGARLMYPVTIQFNIDGVAAGSEPPAIAAVESTPAAVDLRFAGPLVKLPEEPFGIRQGQQRVPARVERVADDWFRILPDLPLDPSLRYHLMAGPGVELPLLLAPRDEGGRMSPVWAAMDESGRIHVRLTRRGSVAGIEPGTLAVLDGDGVAVACEMRWTGDRRTLILAPFRRASRYRILWQGREIAVMEGGEIR